MGQRLGGPGATRRWAAVLLGALALLVLFDSVGLAAARRLGLVDTREPFTTLSFVQAGAPASTLPRGGAVPLAFRIGNEEGGPRTYRWSVELLEGAKPPRTLASGVATVGDLRSEDVSVTVAPPERRGPATIEVRLASPPEAITLHLGTG